MYLFVSWTSAQKRKRHGESTWFYSPVIQLIFLLHFRRISPLRFATPEGYNAIFIDSVDPDVANYSFVEAMKIASLAIDVLGIFFFI